MKLYKPAVVSWQTGQALCSGLQVGHVGESEGSVRTVGGISGPLKKIAGKSIIFIFLKLYNYPI